MLKMCMDYLKGFMTNKKGQGLVEYGLIIGLVVVGAIAALGLLGDQIVLYFNNILTALGITPPA